jgi:hypothetical protein
MLADKEVTERNERERQRDEKKGIYEAKHKLKQEREASLAAEFHDNLEANFGEHKKLEEKKRIRKREEQQATTADLKERRRIKEELVKESKSDASAYYVEETAWRAKKKLQTEKVKEEATLERRSKVIEAREVRKKKEDDKLAAKNVASLEFREESKKEREYANEISKARVVKNRVYKQLERLPEKVSLLDIPFGG